MRIDVLQFAIELSYIGNRFGPKEEIRPGDGKVALLELQPVKQAESFEQVKEAINNDQLIIAGLQLSKNARHVVLITGFDQHMESLLIFDPFEGVKHMYFKDFTFNNKFSWIETMLISKNG